MLSNLFKDNKILLSSAVLTAGLIVSGCSSSGSDEPTEKPTTAAEATLGYGIKSFDFSWTDVDDATYYRLLENADGESGFSQVGDNINSGEQSYAHTVALYNRLNASYMLQSCNDGGCTDSEAIYITGNLNDAIGYFKASNAGSADDFGGNYIALNKDGTVLAVAARNEDSSTTGVSDDSSSANDDGTADSSGAVYIFRYTDNNWTEEAYIKASKSDASDGFGFSLALSDDGNTLVVGSRNEDSNTTGVSTDSNNANNDGSGNGAVYVYSYANNSWNETAYIKPSVTTDSDYFSDTIALSGDGFTLAVGASFESSASTGINSTPNDDGSADASGAVYLFNYSSDAWTQTAYIKASESGQLDKFGSSLALNEDGTILAVSAIGQDDSTKGVTNNTASTIAINNTATDSGVVYIFTYVSSAWSETAYIKASNAHSSDSFGYSVALNNDGTTLAVSAPYEASSTIGVNTDTASANNDGNSNGAVYVYTYTNSAWSESAYIKSSNNEEGDFFGRALSLNADGSSLAISATGEDSSDKGVSSSSSTDNDIAFSGAVYVFDYEDDAWTETAYIKANNPGDTDLFGVSIAFSGDGETLAVGANEEDGSATSISAGTGEDKDDAYDSGAVYLY